MKTRYLGPIAVSEIGFGTMSFAPFYGEAPARSEAIRVIRGAHERGVGARLPEAVLQFSCR